MKKIVLTGGPCGGKTTAQKELAAQFAREGVRVICVPEVATLLLGAGFSIADFLLEKKTLFQSAILRHQLALEDSIEHLAEHSLSQKTLMICDRGAMDGKAYCTQRQWQSVLEDTGLDESHLLGRYDHIFHLTTTADGAVGDYSTLTNACRFESVEEAIQTDRKLRIAWQSHRNHHIYSNEQGLAGKIEKIRSHLSL